MVTWSKLLKLLYEGKRPGLTKLDEAQYGARLRALKPEQAKAAFERAWATRNFEIEMYWRRATYFWAFSASALAGYFALVTRDAYLKPDRFQHAEVFCLVCLGFLLSLAWLLTNRGSKQWQRHWEVHVDLLEDAHTGPLYKTVHPEMTYSVSKINEIVSCAFCVVWAIFGIKFLVEQDLINWSLDVNWFVLAAAIVTVTFAMAMTCGYGRGRFGERPVQMHSRSVTYAATDVGQAAPAVLPKPMNLESGCRASDSTADGAARAPP